MNLAITYLITFIVAYCSITYELLLAQTLSTVLGNTVLRYSLTIGFYLAAMGVGAMMCNIKKRKDPIMSLVKVEIALTIVGGLSVIFVNFFDVIQKYIYSMSELFQEPLFMNGSLPEIIFFLLSQSVIIIIGIFSGFEIPMLIHMAESEKKGTTNMVLGIDYFGSLGGSLLFPLVLLPGMGIFSIAFFVAILNGLAALGIIFSKKIQNKFLPVLVTILLMLILSFGLYNSDNIKQFYLKKFYYYDKITSVSDLFLPNDVMIPDVEYWESPYQHIEIVTSSDYEGVNKFYESYSKKWEKDPTYPKDKWLFLNGEFQFFSLVDEIYHEYIVHIPIMLTQVPEKVCILGGGDGLVVRELLKYPDIKKIYQVELDPKMIELSTTHPLLLRMNEGSLNNPRVKILIRDAFEFMRNSTEKFDAIIIDFPKPNDYNLSILYSAEFYNTVRKRLTPDGFAVADLPDGEWASGLSYFEDYYSTIKSTGFRHVFPIHSLLEADNPKAQKLLEDDLIQSEILEIIQIFMFMTDKKLPAKKKFKDPGFELNVLNKKRFHLAFPNFPRKTSVSMINSIYQPTIPRFEIFNINFPY